MKNLSALLASVALFGGLAHADSTLTCKRQVTKEIEGKEMFNVVERVHSKDGIKYLVVFRTASGDAEEASVAVVTVNPETCAVKNVKYVRGEH